MAIATVVALLWVVFNVVILRRARTVFAPVAQKEASLFDFAGQIREFGGYIKQWKDLASKNQELEKMLALQKAGEVSTQALKDENQNLKDALHLANRVNREVIPAGIFNISLSPSGYAALINKGTDDGVQADDIVVSPEGVLVGKVDAVFHKTAEVRLVSDPDFKITAKVFNGSVSGIARGALDDGMTLDLVVQTDDIKEGDILVSTGDDMVPSGLIIGKVSNVQVNETQLFKKVKIEPVAKISNGRVEVIKQ